MGGRSRELAVREVTRTAVKLSSARASCGRATDTVPTDARWPSAQVVMSGQLALQQE